MRSRRQKNHGPELSPSAGTDAKRNTTDLMSGLRY